MIYLDYPTSLPQYDKDDSPIVILGHLDGVEAWSNGHVMFRGKPPVPGRPLGNWLLAISKADPGGMPEIHPLAVALDGSKFIVWFNDGKTAINFLYFRMCVERFPNARFFCDGDDPHHVRVEEYGARCGIIARLMVGGGFSGHVMPCSVQELIETQNPVQRETKDSQEKAK